MPAIEQYIQAIVDKVTINDNRFSPQIQYRMNLLRIIIYTNIIGTIILLLYGLFGNVSNKTVAVIVTIPIIGFNIWAMRRVNRGKVKNVARLIISINWVSIAITAFGSGGLYSSAIMGMMILLIIATLLLDAKARFLFYIITITIPSPK